MTVRLSVRLLFGAKLESADRIPNFSASEKPVGHVLKSAEDIGVNLPSDLSDICDWSFVMH
jgi:hypothetical protein